MALGHPRSIAPKELRLQRGNRRCADVAVINHGETDGQMDDRRPVEAKREDRQSARQRRKEGKSDHQGDREREGETERERAWPIWTRELVCHLTSPRPRRLVSRFAQSDIRFVQ